MSGKRSLGLPFCAAKSKRTGHPCRNRAVTGATVCRMHGGGTRSRVHQGIRKMPGRPVAHGGYANPERIRWDTLGERQKAILMSGELRRMDKEVALLKAAFDMQSEAIQNGTFTESDAPATWLLQNGCRLIEVAERVIRAMSRAEQFQVSESRIMELFRRVFEKYIPSERQGDAQQEVEAGLAAILEAA